jgi:phosphoribosylanthranilate isomerase
MTVRIKICGITCREDAQKARECGADYIGIIVNIAGSRRSVSTQQAVEISSGIPSTVLLMEGQLRSIESALLHIKPHAVQLIGQFPYGDIHKLKGVADVKIWKTIHVPRRGHDSSHELEHQVADLQHHGIDALVLDTLVPGHKGGTGQTCDWHSAARIVQSVELPVFLAGGLTPENVTEALSVVKPFGVDISSGVESSPGCKDYEKISRFIYQVTAAQKHIPSKTVPS